MKKKLIFFFENLDNKEESRYDYLNVKNDFDGQIAWFEQLQSDGKQLSKEQVASYSYALLKCERYDDVIKLLRPYYDNPKLVDGVIMVNYQLARKKLGNEVKDKINKKLLGNKYVEYSDFEKLGAYALIDESGKAYDALKKVLERNPIFKYTISGWPVIEKLKDQDKFAKILNPNWKKL